MNHLASNGWPIVLNVGSQIVAVKTVGPVREGTRGVIAAVAEAPVLIFWSRRVYLCTFPGRINLAMRPSEIDDCGHAPARWRSFRTS